jgi:integrase
MDTMSLLLLEEDSVYSGLNITSFLSLPSTDISDLLIKYLVSKKNQSHSSQNVSFSAIKHLCEMIDVILNWKKIKKFMGTEEDTETDKDRGYTHEKIKHLLTFCDYRIRTAFLLFASTGIRAGAIRQIILKHIEKTDAIKFVQQMKEELSRPALRDEGNIEQSENSSAHKVITQSENA